MYRGILQTRIEAVWGRLAAILIANTLFTAWHIPTRYLLAQGIEGEAGNLGSVLIGTGIPVFIVGMIFSLLWDRYRRFWPLVLLTSAGTLVAVPQADAAALFYWQDSDPGYDRPAPAAQPRPAA